MSDMTSFVTGLSNSINGYLQAGQQQKRTQENASFEEGLKEQGMQKGSDIQLSQQEQLEKYQHDMQGQVTPDMASTLFSTISPEFGQAAAKAANDFKTQNGRFLTTDEATKAFDPIMKALNAKTLKGLSEADKDAKEQDALEKQAMDRITQVRGDQSVLRTEAQRDASGMAYETLTKAQAEGRHLSSVEYNDLAAQLWKARTGSSVTAEELRKLAPPTAQTSADHLAAWASGNPNLIGATSTETENNLKQFIVSSGLMADKQHDSYMSTRMVKPTRLRQETWDRLTTPTRGLSFAEQQSVSDKTHSQAANSDPLGILGHK